MGQNNTEGDNWFKRGGIRFGRSLRRRRRRPQNQKEKYEGGTRGSDNVAVGLIRVIGHLMTF